VGGWWGGGVAWGNMPRSRVRRVRMTQMLQNDSNACLVRAATYPRALDAAALRHAYES